MARILVVESESALCMSVGVACTGRRHTVELATSSEQALQKGVRFRPDVVITDWMLDDRFNGIEVWSALRAVVCGVRSVLMTGFASVDVRRAASEAGMGTILEKPVDMQAATRAIEAALDESPSPPPVELGLIEFGASGRVLHANDTALATLGRTRSLEGGDLADHFSRRTLAFVEQADDEWFPMTLEDATPTESFQGFVVRGRGAQSNLLLLVRRSSLEWKNHRITSTLLSLGRPPAPPSAGGGQRVVVVDPDDLQRKLATGQLRAIGLVPYAAESLDRGLRTVTNDRCVKIVLVEWGDGEGIAGFVDAVRGLGRETTVIGMSTGYRKREFEALGVDRFVVKPVIGTNFQRFLSERSTSRR